MTTTEVIRHLHAMVDRLERLLIERGAGADNLPYVVLPFETETGEMLRLRVAVEVADPPLHTDRPIDSHSGWS